MRVKNFSTAYSCCGQGNLVGRDWLSHFDVDLKGLQTDNQFKQLISYKKS